MLSCDCGFERVGATEFANGTRDGVRVFSPIDIPIPIHMYACVYTHLHITAHMSPLPIRRRGREGTKVTVDGSASTECSETGASSTTRPRCTTYRVSMSTGRRCGTGVDDAVTTSTQDNTHGTLHTHAAVSTQRSTSLQTDHIHPPWAYPVPTLATSFLWGRAEA